MSKQVRFRRGSTAQHATFTGALAEVTVDTDKNVAVVHNATTAGGIPVGREDRPRGFTQTVYITATGANTYSTVGKTDLKRLRVTCYGAGGGGSNSGGGVNAAGGNTTFGTYVTATGGAAGGGNTGGAGGSGSGTNTFVEGGQGGISGTQFSFGSFFQPQGEGGTPVGGQSFDFRGSGGGLGGGSNTVAGKGICGGGGGPGAAGSNGSIIVEEIYGLF